MRQCPADSGLAQEMAILQSKREQLLKTPELFSKAQDLCLAHIEQVKSSNLANKRRSGHRVY